MKSDQIHAPAALPAGTNAGSHRKGELGGPQSRSGRFGEEKIALLVLGLEGPTR